MLLSAAGHTAPKYGQRHYDLSRGSANSRKVDLQPYRRLYGAMLLQQVRLCLALWLWVCFARLSDWFSTYVMPGTGTMSAARAKSILYRV